jgi:ABC-2 type transport system permease protein
MRGIFTIAVKDFKSLFHGPLFFVVAGFCTVFWSFNFFRNLLMFQERSFQYAAMMRGQGQGPNLHFEVFTGHISLVHLLLLLAIPALTMRLLAEEKKGGTYDLLMTCPVTSWQIVGGKLLAGVGIVTVLLLISALYPLSIALFSPIEWGPLAAAYIGVWLLSTVYVGVGLFGSSLTRSVFLAIIISFIFNVTLLLVGTQGIQGEAGIFSSILDYASVREHIVDFFKGSLRLTSFVYLLSLIGLSSFLTERVVESSRWR